MNKIEEEKKKRKRFKKQRDKEMEGNLYGYWNHQRCDDISHSMMISATVATVGTLIDEGT